jgi:hypothetical protein
MRAVVFLGPSMEYDEARSILPNADYLPPAARGDIAAAVKKGYDAIGLVDGVFYQRAAVAPREILNALEGGIQVVGGSSMGALRASELDVYGMVGVGKIYRWYKEGVINSDDEVALVFHPETHRALSDPMVNIRATLELLHSKGMITPKERALLIRATRETPFQLRSHIRIVQGGLGLGLAKDRAARLLELMEANKVDQKREDAREVLRKLKEILR